MLNPRLRKLLNEEMTRKEFLRLGAITVASLVGVVGIITELLSHGATPYSSAEAESGTRNGDATLLSDSTASGGETIKFGTTSSGPTLPKIPANVSFGMFMPEGDYTTSNISSVESLIDRKIDLFLDYQNWDRGTAAIPTVPTSVMSGIGTADYQWTIQPSSGPNGATAANCVQWPGLIAGDYDSEIQAFGSWIQNTWKRDLYVRFAHEMNGKGWYDWQLGGSCSITTAAEYAEGFNKFATVLKATTSYAKLVWAVNIGYNNVASFYPSECDIMAMDGYNNTSNNTWTTDTQVFSSTYEQLAACDATKPIWIAEMGCMEPSQSWYWDPSNGKYGITQAAAGDDGGSGTTYPAQPQYSKATWVTTFMNNTAYPRVTATTWFNVQKERDWLVNSSSGSTTAFNNAFANTRNGVPLT